MFQPQQPYPGWGAPPMWQQPQYRPPDDGGIQNARTVANEAEARQCVCPLGSRVLLMDASEPRFYVKETDFNNVSTVRAYEFHEASSACRAPATSASTRACASRRPQPVPSP